MFILELKTDYYLHEKFLHNSKFFNSLKNKNKRFVPDLAKIRNFLSKFSHYSLAQKKWMSECFFENSSFFDIKNYKFRSFNKVPFSKFTNTFLVIKSIFLASAKLYFSKK